LSAVTHDLPPAAVNAKLIGLITSGAVFLGIFLSGFVIDEPAPYDLYMTGLIAVWALFGLRISRAVSPLLVLLVLFNIGGLIAMTQMEDLMDTPLYLSVSLFLAFTAVFFAAVVEAKPDIYRLIFMAYVASAVLTSVAGIAGYFHLFPGAAIFTKYERAAGVFQDPNVFGPFLALPGIYLLYLLLTGPVSRMPLIAMPLLIIVGGIFLSFSRGAWGLFAVAAILLTGALFLQSRSGMFRLRIVVMTIAARAADSGHAGDPADTGRRRYVHQPRQAGAGLRFGTPRPLCPLRHRLRAGAGEAARHRAAGVRPDLRRRHA
jgi:hypothetical protein